MSLQPYDGTVDSTLPASLSKGERTRELILSEAVVLASQLGLDGLTIGALAERTGLSKSGLFAHFGSREDLQLATLDRTARLFRERVFTPSLSEPRGLPRLRGLFARWLRWAHSETLPGGCVFLSAGLEFDDRPGPVRERVAEHLKVMRGAVAKAIRLAMDEGQLRPDLDPWQLAFELWALACGAQFDRSLFQDPRAEERALAAFDRLIDTYRT